MFSTNAVNAPVPMTAPAAGDVCPAGVALVERKQARHGRGCSQHSAGFDSWAGMLLQA